jgi:hypothetical protein
MSSATITSRDTSNRRPLSRLDRALKLPGEPRPDYIGLSTAEREHRCEQIDRLIEWLQNEKRELRDDFETKVA